MSKTFVKRLLDWNNTNERSMPWKGEKNPYHIWLSEIILQQTKVEQGLKYYEKFIRHYPTIQSLASASENEVFKDWEGLGYYNRARNMHHTAKHIVSTYSGIFPATYDDILRLKGVGPYTAAAIASFAYDLPHAVVDGNVIRVLARFFGIEAAFDTTAGRKLFDEKAQNLLDLNNPATYNQAIMDFGATLCKPIAPLCEDCPMNRLCFAYQHDLVTQLPYKSKKIVKKTRFFNFLVFKTSDEVLIQKRSKKDVWQGLHDFVLLEEKELFSIPHLQNHQSYKNWGQHIKGKLQLNYSDCQQVLTHQKIFARFFIIKCDKLPIIQHYFPVKIKKIGSFAFPKLINFFLDKDFINFK